jgi:hypothetical protein
VRLERTSTDDLFRAYRIDGGRIVARVLEPAAAGDVEHDVTVPNAADRAAVIAALSGTDTGLLEDRHAVFLAASHPYKARLFQAAIDDPVTLPRVTDVLPNRGGRWLYRARLADAAGNLSADAMTLRGVVRVPFTTAIAPPQLAPAVTGTPPNRLRVSVQGSSEIRWVLAFVQPIGPREHSHTGELLRIPNARELYPLDGVRVRLENGTSLSPLVKSLADPGVEGTPPVRIAPIDIPAPPGQRMQVWVCAMTRDGVVSPLAGPWRAIGAA